MSSNNDELNLPWRIYYFDEDGMYAKHNVFECKDVNHFKTHAGNIKEHNRHKLEVMVCDSLDYCIMHWKDGERIFP